jgi:hypothetical protein
MDIGKTISDGVNAVADTGEKVYKRTKEDANKVVNSVFGGNDDDDNYDSDGITTDTIPDRPKEDKDSSSGGGSSSKTENSSDIDKNYPTGSVDPATLTGGVQPTTYDVSTGESNIPAAEAPEEEIPEEMPPATITAQEEVPQEQLIQNITGYQPPSFDLSSINFDSISSISNPFGASQEQSGFLSALVNKITESVGNLLQSTRNTIWSYLKI